MSTTTTDIFSTATASETVPSHTRTSHGGGGTGPPGISPSSSLLFGFLVTFLALFVAFMACGLGSRRARDVRRRMQETGQMNMTRPEMWDVWIEDLKGSDGGKVRWEGVQPLAASFKRPFKPPEPPVPVLATVVPAHNATPNDTNVSQPPPETSPTNPNTVPSIQQISQTTPIPIPTYYSSVVSSRGMMARVAPVPLQVPLSYRYPLPQPADPAAADAFSWLDFLPDFIVQRIERIRGKRDKRKPADGSDDDEVESLQVSILIAMPAPPSARRGHGGSSAGVKSEAGVVESLVVEGESTLAPPELKEYVLGVAEVPWKSGTELS